MSQDRVVEEVVQKMGDPSMVPQVAWSFLLGVAASELARMGAKPEEIHQMIELTLQQQRGGA